MRLTFIILTFLFINTIAAQKSWVIFHLGVDTTMIGYYEKKGNTADFKIMSRPGLTFTEATVDFYPNGEIKTVRGQRAEPNGFAPMKVLMDYRFTHERDSTFIFQVTDGKERVFRYPGKIMVANGIGSPFLYLLPVLAYYAPKNIGEVKESSHVVGSFHRKFTIKRLSPQLLEMGSNLMGFFKVHLDKQGNPISVDGIGTSWNVTGSFHKEFDIDKNVSRFIKKDLEKPLVSLSKRDSVLANIGTVNIRLDYSRPAVRGRQIYGAVVPFDRVWRTGANEPTRIRISDPVIIGGKELQAGYYSIFTIPQEKSWTLIINSQTSIWGTDHNPQYDVLRLPMEVTDLANPVELLTISINPVSKTTGELTIAWDKKRASISIQTQLRNE